MSEMRKTRGSSLSMQWSFSLLMTPFCFFLLTLMSSLSSALMLGAELMGKAWRHPASWIAPHRWLQPALGSDLIISRKKRVTSTKASEQENRLILSLTFYFHAILIDGVERAFLLSAFADNGQINNVVRKMRMIIAMLPLGESHD